VQRLNAVTPYDWRTYLTDKVYNIAAKPPLEGLTQGGYDLVYTDQPTKWIKSGEARSKSTDLSYSGGLGLAGDGKITSVIWDSAAFNAGLSIGDTILAVNGRSYSGDALKTAITAAKGTTTPIDLLIKSGDLFRTARLDWHGGLRYPRLVKIGRGKGTLDQLLESK